jgi:hypothetical protein
VVRVDPLTNEVVGDANGREKRARIKDVQPVPPDSTAVRDPRGKGATGDAHVVRKQRAATEDLKLRVANILATPRTLLQLCGRLDPANLATLHEQKLTLSKFLHLWAHAFELRNGKWTTKEGAASSSAPRQSTVA